MTRVSATLITGLAGLGAGTLFVRVTEARLAGERAATAADVEGGVAAAARLVLAAPAVWCAALALIVAGLLTLAREHERDPSTARTLRFAAGGAAVALAGHLAAILVHHGWAPWTAPEETSRAKVDGAVQWVIGAGTIGSSLALAAAARGAAAFAAPMVLAAVFAAPVPPVAGWLYAQLGGEASADSHASWAWAVGLAACAHAGLTWRVAVAAAAPSSVHPVWSDAGRALRISALALTALVWITVLATLGAVMSAGGTGGPFRWLSTFGGVAMPIAALIAAGGWLAVTRAIDAGTPWRLAGGIGLIAFAAGVALAHGLVAWHMREGRDTLVQAAALDVMGSTINLTWTLGLIGVVSAMRAWATAAGAALAADRAQAAIGWLVAAAILEELTRGAMSDAVVDRSPGLLVILTVFNASLAIAGTLVVMRMTRELADATSSMNDPRIADAFS
jgi:hypothetical protein